MSGRKTPTEYIGDRAFSHVRIFLKRYKATVFDVRKQYFKFMEPVWLSGKMECEQDKVDIDNFIADFDLALATVAG